MLTEAVLVAIVTALAGILVELIRTRKKATAAAEQTAKVVHEVTPNSGTSMKDAVGRIEKSVNTLKANVSAIKEDVDDVKADVKEIRRDQLGYAERIAALEAFTGSR